MKQRILNIIAVLFLIVGTATAQNINVTYLSNGENVPDFILQPREDIVVNVNISDATEMTALQFNLSLPSGMSLLGDNNVNPMFCGDAVKGHTVNVLPLESGDYLVVLYNMNKTTFGDGVLLSIPVVAGENGGTTTGCLYNVRMSTADAVSHKCEDVSFKVTIKNAAVEVTGITLDKATVTITEGETETLVATVTPADATDKTVTWTTSNSAVATVDGGVVTAVKAGTATITATAGGYSASCVVTVEAKPEPEEPTTPTVSPITSLAELSNSGVYYIYQANHSKGATSWAVATNGKALKSNKDLNIATDMNDTRQQFAILSIDGGATRYLYHVATKKFVNKDGSLSTTPADAISFMNGAYDNTFFAYFDGSHYVNVGGSQQMIIDGWNTPDGGNSCSIIPVGEFDSAAALKAINDLATGIDKVKDENGEVKTIYDLQGRKVENPTTGIYIINGKKVLVK